jgi:hypothetical protein
MPMRREQVAAALQYLGDKADLKRRYERMVSLDQPQDSDAVDMAVEMGASIVPGVGQALAVRDFERARRADDEAGMAMAAASAVPVGRLIGALKGFDPAMARVADAVPVVGGVAKAAGEARAANNNVIGIRSRQVEKMADRINEAMGGGPQPLSDNVQREMKLATSVLQSKNPQAVEDWIQAYYNSDLPMEQFEAATSNLRKTLLPETVDALIQNAGTFRTVDQFKAFLNATPKERAKQLAKVSK